MTPDFFTLLRRYALRVARGVPTSSRACSMLCALLLLLISANESAALPLANYRERVRQATTALESLTLVDDDESETEYLARRARTMSAVRAAVPPAETVEWNGKKLRVDNRWLDEELKEYEQIPFNEPKRVETLARMTERLHALSERLDELEGKANAEAARKDEDKARMTAILRRAEYSKQAAEESAFRRLLNRLMEWLKKILPRTKPIKPGPASAFAYVARIVVYALCLAVLVFLAWRYGPGLLERLRSRKPKSEKRGPRIVLGERLESDQTAADLLNEAELLARNGDLRAAIRKGYIALLCELGDRKILRLEQHKTNRDYLRAVQEREALYREMRQLTNSFENHWYGFIPATINDWTNFRARYQQALKE